MSQVIGMRDRAFRTFALGDEEKRSDRESVHTSQCRNACNNVNTEPAVLRSAECNVTSETPPGQFSPAAATAEPVETSGPAR